MGIAIVARGDIVCESNDTNLEDSSLLSFQRRDRVVPECEAGGCTLAACCCQPMCGIVDGYAKENVENAALFGLTDNLEIVLVPDAAGTSTVVPNVIARTDQAGRRIEASSHAE